MRTRWTRLTSPSGNPGCRRRSPSRKRRLPNAVSSRALARRCAGVMEAVLEYTADGSAGVPDPCLKRAFLESTAKYHIHHQSEPKPFNPPTTIRYDVPVRLHVTLAVFSSLGQQVAIVMGDDPGRACGLGGHRVPSARQLVPCITCRSNLFGTHHR